MLASTETCIAYCPVHDMLAYTLHRSRRRTVAIHVHDGRVEVRAPLRAAQRDIDAFVNKKTPWITKKLAELRERSAEQFCVDNGCMIAVMGVNLTIGWQVAERPLVKQCDGSLLMLGHELDEKKVRHLFLRWLSGEAKQKLLPMAQQRINSMGLAHRLTGFTLRYTRSLWGRCSSTGNILFNPLILLAPLTVIDYLIVHEACHLRYMNHSREFWSLVASHCPDWQVSRRWLKVHGHTLRVD